MRSYEMTYLVFPELSEDELRSFSEKINSFIAQEAGILEQETKPIKQRLGYPIKGKTEAFLITINFKLGPENLEKIEKKIQAENKLIRYIISAKQPLEKTLAKKPKPRRIPKSLMQAEEKGKEETPKTEKKASGLKKVELKEIDKKIEEILKE